MPQCHLRPRNTIEAFSVTPLQSVVIAMRYSEAAFMEIFPSHLWLLLFYQSLDRGIAVL